MTNKEILEIPIGEIKVSSFNPRMEETAEIGELAESLKEVGQVEPPIIRPGKEGYELIVGKRRYLAAKQAGFDKITCIVREMDDIEAALAIISENLHRKDLTAVEKSAIFKKLFDLYRPLYGEGGAIDKMCRELQLKDETVRSYIGLEELSNEAKEVARRHEISHRILRKVAPTLKDIEKKRQGEVLEFIAEKKVKKPKIARELAVRAKMRSDEEFKSVAEDLLRDVRKTAEYMISAPVPARIYEGLVRAAEDRESSKAEIIRTSLNEWLVANKYIS